MSERPSWHVYFMKMAMLVSERSTCVRRKVGAVWGLDSIQIRFEETQNQCYIYNTGQKINWFVIIFTKTLKENYTLFIDHNRCFQIVPT